MQSGTAAGLSSHRDWQVYSFGHFLKGPRGFVYLPDTPRMNRWIDVTKVLFVGRDLAIE
tara:strand:- start:263 stop:439 length:177 start_codon:yes stop_codon:yes gene_type:complete